MESECCVKFRKSSYVSTVQTANNFNWYFIAVIIYVTCSHRKRRGEKGHITHTHTHSWIRFKSVYKALFVFIIEHSSTDERILKVKNRQRWICFSWRIFGKCISFFAQTTQTRMNAKVSHVLHTSVPKWACNMKEFQMNLSDWICKSNIASRFVLFCFCVVCFF